MKLKFNCVSCNCSHTLKIGIIGHDTNNVEHWDIDVELNEEEQ